MRRLLWFAALLTLTACVRVGEPVDPQHAGTPAEAAAIATEWLQAVSGGEADRGWSLLHPLTQERLYGNDPDRYAADAAGTDWNGFGWDIEREPVWDGNYTVTVALAGSVEPVGELADGHLMQLVKGDSSDEAIITVRIDVNGSRGILGP